MSSRQTQNSCQICYKRWQKDESHQCIVCNNVYTTVPELAAHQKARGHIGGHYEGGGPLSRTRTRQEKEKRSGLDEEDEALGLPRDDDDDVDPEEDEEQISIHDDDIEEQAPKLSTSSSRSKRKAGSFLFSWRFL